MGFRAVATSHRKHDRDGCTRRCLFLLAMLLMSPSASAAVYRWVDEKGAVHYSDSPPPGRKATEIKVAPSAPPSEVGRATPLDRTPAEADREPSRPDTRAQELQSPASGIPTQDRTLRCAAARQQLGVLERGGPVFRRNELGERIFLDDSARDAEIARFRREVAAYCSEGPADHARDENRARQYEAQILARERCMRAKETLQDIVRPEMRASARTLKKPGPPWLVFAAQGPEVRSALEFQTILFPDCNSGGESAGRHSESQSRGIY